MLFAASRRPRSTKYFPRSGTPRSTQPIRTKLGSGGRSTQYYTSATKNHPRRNVACQQACEKISLGRQSLHCSRRQEPQADSNRSHEQDIQFCRPHNTCPSSDNANSGLPGMSAGDHTFRQVQNLYLTNCSPGRSRLVGQQRGCQLGKS